MVRRRKGVRRVFRRGTILNQLTSPNALWAYPGKPINVGSNPRFYEFDDGVTRLVKWHPSPHGTKACYNELVASRLGQLTGAPILRGTVVYVSDSVIPADHRAAGAKAGFHFASARMEGSNFVPVQHYSLISNQSELPAAAVHLAWLRVGDQAGHNQYLEETTDQYGRPLKRFKLIDMGKMFQNFAWTGQTLVNLEMEYALPKHLADRVTLASLQPAMRVLKSVS